MAEDPLAEVIRRAIDARPYGGPPLDVVCADAVRAHIAAEETTGAHPLS